MPCDTGCFITLPTDRVSPTTYFLKNSDRHPDEAQFVEYYPRGQDLIMQRGSTLRATYVDLPQVDETNAVVLSRPVHMWGAEMGVNDKGLCVGNEALFASSPPHYRNNDCLTGMDIVRLCLERASDVEEAISLVCEQLLPRHRIGGNCGWRDGSPFYYHNGFIMCDRAGTVASLIVLGQEHWMVVVHKSAAVGAAVTLSNSLSSLRWETNTNNTVGGHHGEGAVPHAVAQMAGAPLVRVSVPLQRLLRLDTCLHLSGDVEFPPADLHLITERLGSLIGVSYPRLCDTFGNGNARGACLHNALRSIAARQSGGTRSANEIACACFDALRSHEHCSDETAEQTPVCVATRSSSFPDRVVESVIVPACISIGRFFFQVDVCMHAGCGPVRVNATTGSLVVELSPVTCPPDGREGAGHDGGAPFQGVRVWATLASNPCLTPFKQLELPSENRAGHRAGPSWSSAAWWFVLEHLHRRCSSLFGWRSGLPMISSQLHRAFEASVLDWIHKVERQEVRTPASPERAAAADFVVCLVRPEALDEEAAALQNITAVFSRRFSLWTRWRWVSTCPLSWWWWHRWEF